MGGISVWHWIILFVFFVLPILAVGGLGYFLIRRSRAGAAPAPTTESRLQHRDRLRSSGAITEREFDERRKAILRDV